MIFNQDDENSFLSDKKIEEVNQVKPTETRRRGGYIAANTEEKKIEPSSDKLEGKNDNESNDVNIIIILILIIVVMIVAFYVARIFFSTQNNSNSSTNEKNKTETVDNTNNNSNSNNNVSSEILKVTDTYNAYPVTISSVVYKKGGNFYNNNEKITGDKVYVEYKQISGLKDKTKEDTINNKLKEKVVSLYDKEYLSDENTLFVDIHTKISINFNTLSYIIYRTGEDIDGNHILEKVESLNIRLYDLKDISFEDVFIDSSKINSVYKSYVKGNVSAYYFTPENLYVYDSSYKETKIDLKDNASNIAIFKKYSTDSEIFNSTSKSQKAFTTLDSTVSEETTDRAFKQN